MDISKHKQKRLLLLFLLGIGLPSLLLGYLAFRGIQNDQALLEIERLNEHRRIAELITRSIDESIFKVEQAFLNTIADHQELYQPALIRSLDSLKNQQPLVEEVFFFQNFEKIHLPLAKLLFLRNGSTQLVSISSRTGSFKKTVRIAQQFEFQQKRYRDALTNYKQVFTQVSDLKVKGELLNAIARVQKKSKLLQDAIGSYETIAQDYSHIRIEGGIPLGPAARLELGSLFLTVNDSLGALKTFTELYKGLIHGEWTLEKAQYDFFVQGTKESIEKILSQASLPAPFQSYPGTFRMLKGQEEKHRRITEKLLTFQESAVTDLQAKVPRTLEYPQSSAERFTLESGGHTYLVSLLSWHTKNGNQDSGVWGLLLNAGHLKNNLFQQTLQRHVLSEGTGWIIRGRDGKPILKAEGTPSGSITVKTNFVGNFPPWFVEFYQQDRHLFETFLTSRQSIYFYMFLLIAGILIFGLILTIRTITHELELAKMKSDFVSTISHEFKSPLTSIRQLSEMLKTNRVPSEERRFYYYDILVEQSERLSMLIDNILDFSKIEEGRKEFEFHKVSIGVLLQEIVSTVQDRVRHEGFVIYPKIGKALPSVNVDRTAISQAINNLIDNAIKYSNKVRKVFVHAFTEDQYLIIAVEDFGIGIRKEEINKVFERFYRGGDELTRAVKGSGLGLTLVKKIVEAHHGIVHVESEPGRGSTFSIRLPLQ